ncbi:MAG: hypothetical protein FD156_90 [Nitrospirae bacterium]|nr:MAG: hypothetical protein FD156_90 [Nitrospirota bacterium]
MQLAPIALFTYNRLWHTRQTMEALQKNELAAESELYVFSDGPRSEADREKVRSVREYLNSASGFKKVTVIERDRNLGLAGSIIAGVTETVGRYGRIIVLEDDMVTSPYFLRYMNEALDYYKDEEKVISIHGYIYPVKTKLPDTFFLRGADCWGWATWKRGWDLFEANGQKLLAELKENKLETNFDLHGAYDYTKMLKDQINGENDSWAIRWRASAFIHNKLYLQAGRSLIHNIGNDNSGTHGGASKIFDSKLTLERVSVKKIPLEESALAVRAIEKYMKSSKQSFITRALKRYCGK